MLGAIVGDVVGSIYEFDNIKTKDFPLFSDGSKFTDDTVCTVAVAECLLDESDPAMSLRKWCTKYWRMSYGRSFFDWLRSDEPKPYGSWGNGSAMRVSPVALLSDSLNDARGAAREVTIVTHDHPEGVAGALAVCDAIWMAFDNVAPDTIRRHVASAYGYDMGRTVNSIRPGYAFDESCRGTVPEALICALEADGFEDAIRNAISIGGDSDTVAAIAGAVAEARFGVPPDIRDETLSRLPDDIRSVIFRLYGKSARGGFWPR
jgi:ADP-ribosylglycohydrolase